MSNGVKINWGGFKEAMDRASSGISDTQGLMSKIGVAMKGQTVRRFQKGVSPEGEAWAEVKHPRRDSSGKPRKGKARPLIDTGRLRNSISFSASPFDVHVGSNLIYARIHQMGGKAGRGRKVTIPARPYLGLSEDDQEEIAALVQEHVEGSFK